LQRRFVEAVARECPGVLADLRAKVLPAYEDAAQYLQKHPRPGESCLGLKEPVWRAP
jgi:hypothetical protein